jgi:hypothetical protein
MVESFHPEEPDVNERLEKAYLSFNETVAAMELLLSKGYSEVYNLRQLKEEIAFEMKMRSELGNLTPNLVDELLDTYSAVCRLLQEIENKQ